MPDVIENSPRTGPAPKSDRVRLARLARDAALQVPGVADTVSGATGLFVTVSGDERVPGVTCVASQAGGYDIALRLRCELVPLPALGERVIAAVRRATAASEMGLRIEIVDVVEPVGA